jgi:hypothetical protein
MKSSSDESSVTAILGLDLARRFLLVGFAGAFSLPLPLTPIPTSCSSPSSSSLSTTISYKPSSSSLNDGDGGVPGVLPGTFLRIVPNPLPKPRPPGLNMPPCSSPRIFFCRLSRHGLQIWNVQPGQRSIVSLLRLSHSVHFAVCTFTRVICVGSDEQVRRLPPGVRATGLARETPDVRTKGLLSEVLGVCGRVGVRGVVEEIKGFGILGVLGGAI